jgi:hypothetical protein
MGDGGSCNLCPYNFHNVAAAAGRYVHKHTGGYSNQIGMYGALQKKRLHQLRAIYYHGSYGLHRETRDLYGLN